MPSRSAASAACLLARTLKPMIRLGRRRQRHVRFGDAADAGMEHAHGDLAGAERLQRLGDGSTEPCTSPLMTTEDLLAGSLEAAHHLLERAARRRGERLLALLAHAVVGDLAARASDSTTRRRSPAPRILETEHLDRGRRAGVLELLVALVDQSAHPPPGAPQPRYRPILTCRSAPGSSPPDRGPCRAWPR